MVQLESYLEKWELSAPEPLVKTATGEIYCVIFNGERAVLKLLRGEGATQGGNAGAALRHYDGHGAVRLLESDEGAHLLEYAEGDDLISMVQQGDDERATTIIAEVLNQLHAKIAPTMPKALIPLRRWFQPLFEQAEADSQKGLSTILTRAAPIAEQLLANPQDERVLHGDMHHGNIRYKEGRGWLAYDAVGLYGERAYDIGNVLWNPIETPEIVENEARLLRTADILADKLHIARVRLLAYTFVFTCLSASWSQADGDYDPHAVRMAALIEPHVI